MGKKRWVQLDGLESVRILCLRRKESLERNEKSVKEPFLRYNFLKLVKYNSQRTEQEKHWRKKGLKTDE